MTNLEFRDLKKKLTIKECPKCGGQVKIKRHYTHVNFKGESTIDMEIRCSCGYALHYWDSS